MPPPKEVMVHPLFGLSIVRVYIVCTVSDGTGI